MQILSDTGTHIQQARTDGSLREMTERTARLLSTLQSRMDEPQLRWGGDESVLLDPAIRAEPLVVRQAMAFEQVLAAMPIDIEADELVVGLTVEAGRIVHPETPQFATEAERVEARKEGTTIGAGLSHKTPSYYDLLDRGLLAIIEDVEAIIREVEDDEAPLSETRDEFRAVAIECRAVIAMAHRFADCAERQSLECSDPDRAQELDRIAEVCRRVPAHPARTFHEAVQAFWLVHYALYSTNTRLSCGRLDQYLYPYLAADLEAGRITVAEAQELVDCLWLRFNDRTQIRRESFFVDRESAAEQAACRRGGVVVDRDPWNWQAGHRKRFGFATDAADAINHFGQNILLSGLRPDGTDGTNVLTYLCLNALEKLPFTSPVVTVRLHGGSPKELVARCAEVLKTGGGMPYIDNDDVLIPAYVDLGVPVEDARDYANSNCWETMIEGKSDQELIRGMNFLLCLELALGRGRSKMLGPIGPDTGDPLSFESFEDLLSAWKRQLDVLVADGIDLIGRGVRDGSLEHSAHGRHRYNPFLTALTHDCLSRRADVIRGGARYRIWHVMGEAVANAIDAMAAIRKLVYDDGTVAMPELLSALEANWEGHEPLRQLLIHRAPKFANRDRYADELGREMMEYFVTRARHHAARYPEVIFPISVGTFSWYAMIGREVAASADGRRDGEPVAANFSPVPGADLSGPTAAISSHVAMPVGDLAAGAPIDLRIAAAGVHGDAGTARLAGLLSAFVEMGGNMLTLTVTDVEELKRAMEEPDRYRHLRVRMGGWSAYFVALSEEQQRLHIQRVEHGLA